MPQKLLLKSDLKDGKTLDSALAANNFKEHPERIIYTICKMCVADDNEHAFSSKEITETYREELNQKIDDDKKWNPVDWFSAILSGNPAPAESEGVFDRWEIVFERGKRKNVSDSLWYYRIKARHFDLISDILADIES